MKKSNLLSLSLIILMTNMFIALLGVGLVIPVLPQYILEFNGSGKDIGYLVAAMGLTQFFVSPIGGKLSDKYGRKKILIIGLSLLTVSQLLFAVGIELWMLYLSRLIGGMGVGLIVPANMAYVADVTSKEDRGKGMGYLGAALSFGFVIGPGIGGFLAELGIRVPFYVSALVAGIAAIISLLFLPEPLTKEQQLKARKKTGESNSILYLFQKSLTSKYLILLILTLFMTIGIAKFESIFGLYVDRKYGYSPKDISILLTAGALFGVLLQALFIDKLIKYIGEIKLVEWCFALSAASMILVLLSGHFWYVLLMTICFIGFTSILRPALNTLVSKMAGEEQGFAAGMVNAYSSLGNIIGPAIAGIIFDIHFDIPYVFGAIILLSGLVICVIWSKRKKGNENVDRDLSG
ncbi:MFS transporter [Gracilibacillus sp. YIM 98692]|uniref:MFS transporter n=1 Tax=Gracilibacillus sp. YIM 98692 TaxID=2663532 RepID=UPI0013D27246|nr:MFS transporter [Gracilibacillus sp. YIM 98692]